MVTAGQPSAANPAPRVSVCESCGQSTEAGTRGPRPRFCAECKADPSRSLRYRIATARNLALEANRADVAVELDRAGQLLTPTWTRFGE